MVFPVAAAARRKIGLGIGKLKNGRSKQCGEQAQQSRRDKFSQKLKPR
jgi:hypothetical protein